MTKNSILPALTLVGLICLSQVAPAPLGTTPPEGVNYPVSTTVGGQNASSHYSLTKAGEVAQQAATANTGQPVEETPEPTRLSTVQVGDQVRGADGKLYPNFIYKSQFTPNDPQATQSWTSTANLPATWDKPRGSAFTTLAVIDTGFALNHQEFANRWASNTGETGSTALESASKLNCTDRSLPLTKNCNLIDDNFDGIVDNEIGSTTKQNPSQRNCTAQSLALDKSCNLRDDDNNGFIDDFRGWDFANNDRSVQAGEVTPTGSGTHHGTYTAGVAAATGNNGVGIAGVDWGTAILPIQALDDSGSGTTVSVANAIDYAIARGANVISLSLGGDGDDPLVHQAVRRAIAAGIIVVAAAGNDGCDCMTYPANYPEVLAVGAAAANGQPASFSSYGANLDILAPGVNLYTTDWQPGNQTSAYAAGISGTSLATPIISGLLTRMMSQQPTASAEQLVAALTENTNRAGLTATTPRNNSYGFGFIHAAAATNRVITAVSPQQRYMLSGRTYSCEGSTVGTSAIYEITGFGRDYFTENTVAVEIAKEQGYSATLFTYACIAQIQDAPVNIRSINLLAEFRNIVSSGKL